MSTLPEAVCEDRRSTVTLPKWRGAQPGRGGERLSPLCRFSLPLQRSSVYGLSSASRPSWYHCQPKKQSGVISGHCVRHLSAISPPTRATRTPRTSSADTVFEFGKHPGKPFGPCAAPRTATHPGAKVNSYFTLYNAYGILKLEMRSTAGVRMRARHQETWRQQPAPRRRAAQKQLQLSAELTAHVAL